MLYFAETILKRISRYRAGGRFSDLEALVNLKVLTNNYMPWSSSAMRPGAVQKIINEIVINKKSSVIEFGSGVSTIYIASILKSKSLSGSFCTVEHDIQWVALMREMLDAEGLCDYCEVVHAPLEDSNHSFSDLEWYSEKVLSNALAGKCFDLVIVDGPMAYKKPLRMSRYPALPFLGHEKLISDRCLFVLDDAGRPGEKMVMKEWESEFGVKFKQFPDLGVAIAATGLHKNT